ncbi:MAG: hypothetical protein MUE70_09470 [Desulfobacterales bacterium]|jgi:hypothetical protein|nr:hypothetical protein [Desulfobacterales bacterium]
MLRFSNQYPNLKDLPLKTYNVDLPFNRLNLGVDNVRYDVHLSPEFQKTAETFIFELIIKHSEASGQFIVSPDFNWAREIDEFKRQCIDLLTHAVHQAKSMREIQIDFLAQTALVKMLSENIQLQYEGVIKHFKTIIRKHEISEKIEETQKAREEVASIVHRKNNILRNVGTEIFQYFIDAQNALRELRASNFGTDAILPEELFSNPILQSTMKPDGFFLIENYVLLGHRVEDPVNYNALINILASFLNQLAGEAAEGHEYGVPPMDLSQDKAHSIQLKSYMSSAIPQIDGLIKCIDNMDILFNSFQSLETYSKLKAQKSDKQELLNIKKASKRQENLLNSFFKRITQEKMIDGIVAAYKMQLVFSNYSPPLSPQECLQYLVVPKSRKNTVQKLKRFKKYYGRAFPLRSLNRAIIDIKSTPKRIQKILLIRFLKDFVRYHRDLCNFNLIKDAGDCINLTTDEKIIKLSRENHTLYEFVLSHEETVDKKAIINHVVVKADIRGSSVIINQMKSQHLNPASNFSLNFFDPISKILSLYGATKVFIEGDAIILAIFEHEGAPGRWYGMARACGLAINILNIVKKYNSINQKNGLPSLDIGVGIGYNDAAPTFFYDGSNQIMISPAINVADQLSGCNKALRERLSGANLPFNVYVFQPALDSNAAMLSDFAFLRYNVNGIELAPDGFEKLNREIHLKCIDTHLPDIHPVPMTLYTGTFPTVAGNYQRLVIRASSIPEVSLASLTPIRQTEKNFYEVCTNQKVYDHVKQSL